MRTLLILTLVFATAPAANAGFIIVDGAGNSSTDDFATTGSLTLYLQYTGTDCMLMDVEVDFDYGIISNGALLIDHTSTFYSGIFTPGPTGMQMEFSQGWDDGSTAFPANTNLASFDISWSSVPYPPEMIVSGNDYYSLGTDWYSLNATVAPFIIEIPEPMTMALLGLGACVLLNPTRNRAMQKKAG